MRSRRMIKCNTKPHSGSLLQTFYLSFHRRNVTRSWMHPNAEACWGSLEIRRKVLRIYLRQSYQPPGTGTALGDAARLAAEYGGSAADSVKVTSESYASASGLQFEIHAFQNAIIDAVVEVKAVIQNGSLGLKVKCLSDRVGNIRYRFSVGKECVVLGISQSVGSEVTHLWIKDDPGNCFVPTPRDLFEIVDPKVSSYWTVKIDSDKLLISAKELLEPLFLDGPTNCDEKCVDIFRRIASMMEDEARPLRF
jgi:hypothetical protein